MTLEVTVVATFPSFLGITLSLIKYIVKIIDNIFDYHKGGMNAQSEPSATESAPPIDIPGQIHQLTLRQQRLEKQHSATLGTDVAGLDVLGHLMVTGPATPTDLARHLGISTAATTLVLNRLETAGHISRERHSTDGRKLLVRPMEASAARASQQVAPLISDVEQLTATLDAKQQRTIADFLSQVIACYDAHLR